MAAGAEQDRDLSTLAVATLGAVEVRADPWEPVRLIGGDGGPVAAVMAFLGELQASGRSAATQRSYAMDLLRWFRFGWAIDVGWDQATRVEARAPSCLKFDRFEWFGDEVGASVGGV